jgi:hypothetical protein
MSEHHTKNTLEVTAFCNRCNKPTQHRVDAGRRGPCMDPDHRKNPNLKFRVRFLSPAKDRILQSDFLRFEQAVGFYTRQSNKDTASLWVVTKHANGPDTERRITPAELEKLRKDFLG